MLSAVLFRAQTTVPTTVQDSYPAASEAKGTARNLVLPLSSATRHQLPPQLELRWSEAIPDLSLLAIWEATVPAGIKHGV